MNLVKQAMPIISLSVVFIQLFSIPLPAQPSKLTDEEIASVAVVANQIDISYAEIAKRKSKDAEVLRFAETMTNDHKAIIAQAVALVTKPKVAPRNNAVSKKLNADAENTRSTLINQSAKTFDRAYIDNEVAYHKAVIAVVTGLLIADARNAELKALLEKVVPALNVHLAHAEMIQKQFKIPKVFIVEIKDMKFVPECITVRTADTIIWINRDLMTHDVTEGASKLWSSGPIVPGGSWKMVVAKAANYYCSIHIVMKGKINNENH
jgi:putative membrane protein